MRILLAISVLAFAALLWALIAIVQHVRRARRRRRRALGAETRPAFPPTSTRNLSQTPADDHPELSFTDLAAPPPSLPSTEPPDTEIADSLPLEPETTAIQEPETAELPVDTESATSEPELPANIETSIPEPEITLETEDWLETSAPDELPSSDPVVSNNNAPGMEQDTEAPREDTESNQPEPSAEALEPVYAASFRPTQAAPTPKPFRPSPPKHPLASLVPPLNRPDWAYFNKDMGDLSDPEPRSRPLVRSKSRPTNTE